MTAAGLAAQVRRVPAMAACSHHLPRRARDLEYQRHHLLAAFAAPVRAALPPPGSDERRAKTSPGLAGNRFRVHAPCAL